MQFNGAIDRDIYGVDFKRETYGQDDNEIRFIDSLAVEIRITGTVPIVIDNNIPLSVEDEKICFDNVAGLDFARNKNLTWNDAGIVAGTYSIEVISYFLVKKEAVK